MVGIPITILNLSLEKVRILIPHTGFSGNPKGTYTIIPEGIEAAASLGEGASQQEGTGLLLGAASSRATGSILKDHVYYTSCAGFGNGRPVRPHWR